MESSNTEMKTTTASQHDHHETTEIANLKANTVGKIVLHPAAGKRKHLSPSSSINSSPDSPLDDPFNSNDDDDKYCVSSTESSFSPRGRIPVVFENYSVPNNNPQPPSSDHIDHHHHAKPPITSPHPSRPPPVNNNYNGGPATEAPCNQAMERAYRIPSSVFTRSKSGVPMDWSVASNESLFSIHTGNTSFRNDNNLLWRSGELAGEASLPSDHMFSYSGHQQPNKCAAEMMMRSRELGLAEATMKEVIRESESAEKCVITTTSSSFADHAAASRSRSSHGSGSSNKSFAFSIKAAGESQKGASSSWIPSSVTSEELQAQCRQPVAHELPSTNCDPNKATTPNSCHPKWPSRFSCCSLW